MKVEGGGRKQGILNHRGTESTEKRHGMKEKERERQKLRKRYFQGVKEIYQMHYDFEHWNSIRPPEDHVDTDVSLELARFRKLGQQMVGSGVLEPGEVCTLEVPGPGKEGGKHGD